MKKTLLYFISLLFADNLCQKVKIERNNKKYNAIIYNIWSGEYPGVVINVQKRSQVYGYLDLKKLKRKKVCTIKKGLYHPWSEDNISVKEFLTIAPEVEYLALRDDVRIDDNSNKKIKIKKGDKLTCEAYL